MSKGNFIVQKKEIMKNDVPLILLVQFVSLIKD
jgi:hypothetical protein